MFKRVIGQAKNLSLVNSKQARKWGSNWGSQKNLIIISDRFALPGLCSTLSCGDTFLCFHCMREYNLLHSFLKSSCYAVYGFLTSPVPSFAIIGHSCICSWPNANPPPFSLAYLRQENLTKNTNANVINCDELLGQHGLPGNINK